MSGTGLPSKEALGKIGDPFIRQIVTIAIEKTLELAAVEKAYPGHFMVTADGRAFGSENTWPGLDSWELAGAYLLLGKQRLVRDYLAFVRASQRADGNIPFAIFPADKVKAEGCLKGLRFPEDIYAYAPPGAPSRKWIGLFHHWQGMANPLSVLGSISHILCIAEYFAATNDRNWMREMLPSAEGAARYVQSRIDSNGLIGASGFYIECPPRNRWDGVTQCYAAEAFRLMASLCEAMGIPEQASVWRKSSDSLALAFRNVFWRQDHFAEYVHPEKGLVDAHGLSDVNFAAIAYGLATDEQCRILWPMLTSDPAFWHGGMPTQLVTKPASYEEWEKPEPLPWKMERPLYDVAAMGRVWWLEAKACLRMGDVRRLRESVRLVCESGRNHDGFWFERYHAQPDGSVKTSGPAGYCEYAAVLVRLVLGNPHLFNAGSED